MILSTNTAIGYLHLRLRFRANCLYYKQHREIFRLCTLSRTATVCSNISDQTCSVTSQNSRNRLGDKAIYCNSRKIQKMWPKTALRIPQRI